MAVEHRQSPSDVIDVIDAIVGIVADSQLAVIRQKKPNLVDEAQGYYEALFAPLEPGEFTLGERALVAIRAANHTRSAATLAWYESLARNLGVSTVTIDRVRSPDSAPPNDNRRWSGILQHVDRLVTTPASSTPAHLASLEAAGLSPAAIVTLSQLVAFIAYQTRVVAGLRALGDL